VDTDYGTHIMFYSGDSETSYRDFLIKNTLVSADTEAWYTALVDSVTATESNTDYLTRNLVLSSN
jgi:hypothetical protein